MTGSVSTKNVDVADTKSATLNDVNFTQGTENTTFTGSVIMTGDVSIATSFANSSVGSLIFSGAYSTLDTSGLQSLSVVITDNGSIPSADETYSIIYSTAGANVSISDNLVSLTVNSNNKNIKWTLTDGQYIRSNAVQSAFSSEFSDKVEGNILVSALKVANPRNSGEAKALQLDIANMSSDQQVKSMQRLVEHVAQQADYYAISAVTTGVGSVMGARMSTLQNTQYAAIGSSGVAAGEGDQTNYGVWLTPFYSSTIHDKWKGSAGYKSVASGTTIGVDSMVNDSTSLGAAASYIITDMKYRNTKSGDVTKAKSIVFSLYAMQQLNNNFFLQGQASFSKNSVKNIQKRVNSTSTEMSTGKFSHSSASVELMAGRDYVRGCAVITPLVGLGFSNVNGYDYKETGTTNQNLQVSASSSNQIMAIIGLRSQYTYDIYESLRIEPEMHMFAKHYLAGKRPKLVTKLSGMVEDLVNQSANIKRTTGNVGFGVNVVSGNKEYGVGYDLDIAEKSLGHKFALKARVNF